MPGGSQIPTGSIWGGGQAGRLVAANGWSAWSAAVDERLYSFVRIGASHPGGQGVSVEQDPRTESPTLPLHWGGTAAAEGRPPHAAAGPRPAPSSGCSLGAPRLQGLKKRLQAGLVVTARTRLTRLCPVHSACGPLAPPEDQLQLRRAGTFLCHRGIGTSLSSFLTVEANVISLGIHLGSSKIALRLGPSGRCHQDLGRAGGCCSNPAGPGQSLETLVRCAPDGIWVSNMQPATSDLRRWTERHKLCTRAQPCQLLWVLPRSWHERRLDFLRERILVSESPSNPAQLTGAGPII